MNKDHEDKQEKDNLLMDLMCLANEAAMASAACVCVIINTVQDGANDTSEEKDKVLLGLAYAIRFSTFHNIIATDDAIEAIDDIGWEQSKDDIKERVEALNKVRALY